MQNSKENILKRQSEGIEIAKQQGKYKGKNPINPPNLSSVIEQWKAGSITATKAAKILGMSRSTFYRKLKESYTA